MEASCKDLLCHDTRTIRINGADYPVQRKSVPPKQFYPLSPQRTEEQARAHQKNATRLENRKFADNFRASPRKFQTGKKIRNTATGAETPKDIGGYEQVSLRGNNYKDLPKKLEPPSITLETLIPKRNLKSRSLKRLSRLDTAENPAQ